MEQITEQQIKINFDELNDLELIYNKKIGLTVFYEDVKYEFILKLEKKTDELIIVGSGALGNRPFDRSRPLYHRHSWNFKRSTIYYNDPTYYVDDVIKGAWCFGTKENYYLKKIATILDILIHKLNIDYENVLFYGSSAGGFTSLILATLFKGTLCLADIPQIYVDRYKSKFRQLDGWRPLKEYYYGDEITDEEFLELHKFRLNFVELCKKEKYIPNAYMVLDCSVDLDFKTQYTPFFHELNSLPFSETSNWIKLIINGKNQGHVSVPQKETLKLIDDIFHNNTQNEDSFESKLNPTKSNLDLIVSKLEKYNTARFDIIIEGKDSYLELVEIDDYESLSQPHWLSDPYSGFIITNKNNSIDFKVRCVGGGNLDIKLRGIDKKLNKQRVPIYIDFTKFFVNGESVMNKNNIVFHNNPVIHSMKVKDDEIVKVHVERVPF